MAPELLQLLYLQVLIVRLVLLLLVLRLFKILAATAQALGRRLLRATLNRRLA